MRSKIKTNIYEAIKDAFYKNNLTAFAEAYKQKKIEAYKNLDFKTLQKQLGKMKREQLEHWDELLHSLKKRQ